MPSTRRAPVACGAADPSIRTRRVAVLVADGITLAHVEAIMSGMLARGAHVDVVARARGVVTTADGSELGVGHSHRTASSIFYDALFVPGGAAAIDELRTQADAIRFVEEAFRHGKPIGLLGEARALLPATALPEHAALDVPLAGVVQAEGIDTDDIARFVEEFAGAMQQHRFFERPPLREMNE